MISRLVMEKEQGQVGSEIVQHHFTNEETVVEAREVRMAENDLRNTFIDLTPHRFKLYPGNHFHFPRK